MIDGRIIKGVGGLYIVSAESGLYECGARGIFRKRKVSPAVGDFVELNVTEAAARKGVITRIKPRRNMLERPRVANIDAAVIVFAAKEPALNAELLDRFIITAEYHGIDVIVCFNKVDLADGPLDVKTAELANVYAGVGYSAVRLCAADGRGLDELKRLLYGRVSVFAGPSGVGKSTIINALLQYGVMQTGELSEKIKRGRHTTRHAQLIQANESSFVVDSPGFTTLDITPAVRQELPRLFPEFRQFAGMCRFGDCKHIHEPGCAVREQVGAGVFPARYERYVAFMESDV